MSQVKFRLAMLLMASGCGIFLATVAIIGAAYDHEDMLFLAGNVVLLINVVLFHAVGDRWNSLKKNELRGKDDDWSED